MNACRKCFRPTSGGSLVCAACGQPHPGGVVRSVAVSMVACFGLAVVAGVSQAVLVSQSGPPRASVTAPDWTVAERWNIGLYGVGMAIVLSPGQVNEVGMTRLRSDLRSTLHDRSFVQAYVFTDREAASLRRAGHDESLGPRQDWFERRLVATYTRNDRLGHEALAYSARGVRTGPARLLEW